MIIKGPSVKIGAEAALIPPLKPFVNVSLITVVRSGPGFIPSMIPSVMPAIARLKTRSISIS
jgi:hypothetical protein